MQQLFKISSPKQFHYQWLLLLLSIFFSAKYSQAQDLHFSQYFNNPLLINPANTGFAPDADWRAGVSYRNQWALLTTNPYRTFSAWGDAQLFNNRFENGWLGIGGALLADKAGSGSLTSTKAFGSIAYHQQLGLGSLLSAGFNVGFAQKRIDQTKLNFDNQWNGKFFDVSIPNGEAFATNNVSYFTLQAGLNYAYFPSENAYFNFGVSVANINQPKESFLTANSSTNTQLAMRYSVFANGSFKLNDLWIINPNIYYSQMAEATEVVTGFTAQHNLSGDGTTQLIAGAYYRLGDAIIPTVGYQWNDVKLTVNYDATASSLSSFNKRNGAYEFSLVKTGLFSTGKAMKCPVVKF